MNNKCTKTLTLGIIACVFGLSSCQSQSPANSKPESVQTHSENPNQEKSVIIDNESGLKLSTRFTPPKDYVRTNISSDGFGNYLRHLPLKPFGVEAKLYNGSTIPMYGYIGVVDLPIGKKDLHQCADAVMHLRARYFYEKEQHDSIQFNFTNGMAVNYGKWKQGYRIKISGNNTSWVKRASAESNESVFWNYLEMIFMYAGTLSLSKELKARDPQKMQIGDVFIQGGSPGHAIIVLDMAVNPKTGNKVFMLGQSYMPAREIQVLINPNNALISPWYELNSSDDLLDTPDWTFDWSDLKHF